MITEDIFDVVNEHDEVIGREPRSVVHARGLRHRAAHVLVFNAAGKVFLQLRSMTKDNNPGGWDSSCSGHVDAGETYVVAAERELMEEIGLLVEQPLEPLFKLDACEDTGMEFCWVYRTQSEGPFDLNPEEIDEGRWFSAQELTKQLEANPRAYSPSLRLIWNQHPY
ncbi:MAG: NUDIX domain-containing protein [Verrucomicrobiota bacterium]|nr:NUDIX domain-containing protein [Verrucomicrobiota bacterium]